MRLKKEFELREIAGEFIIVPTGETTLDFNGLITVNEVGKIIWEKLQNECTKEDIVNAILDEYEIDKETAENDVEGFLEKLRNQDII